ncbi:MAG: hypothetical protein QXH60_02480 [Candidatus Pacearchaeota archaeon]
MEKRGLSTIVSSILLILITIIVIIIIASVIIPYVKENLKEENCLDFMEEITIVYDESCYLPEEPGVTPKTEVTIKFGNINLDEIFLIFSNPNSVSSESYELKKGNNYPPGFSNSGSVELPTKGGGEKKYIINNDYRKVSVGASINGKRCSIADEEELFLCL